MSDDGPPLLRPTPRRPFQMALSDFTPPDEDSNPPSPNPSVDPQLLTPNHFPDQTSLSRPASFMNLTSSTLFGIYSPTTATGGSRRERDELQDTPWGTGAQTPVRRPTLDDATYELMKERSHLQKRRSSHRSVDSSAHHHQLASSPAATAFSLSLRGGLLFVLGVGYGALVAAFHRADGGHDWPFLLFWGVAGVVLGALLPWFDTVWEDTFGEQDADEAVVDSGDMSSPTELTSPGTDWALVMRAIGAFVGIVFAIRKLAWSSTLQVSITLALVNPLLWWLIDRSKAGFLLSAAVGVAGAGLLLGVNPEMMPTPSSSLFNTSSDPWSSSSSSGKDKWEDSLLLGGLASSETFESGVWMLSVLFCSCVCFGNIGRRLAWGPSAVVKGRWGDVR